MNARKPKAYILVGVPGSGKSTWIRKQVWALGLSVISTDMWVEMEAERLGSTYSEVFKNYMPIAVGLMAAHVQLAFDKKHDLIWDQTSVSVKSRRKKFNMLPGYEMIAIVFPTPDRAELDVRLSGRFGKHIPKNVVDSMIDNFKMPTIEEGFDEVIIV